MSLSGTASAIIATSFISFSCLNKGLVFLKAPKRYADDSRRHKWKNAVVSFVHAFIIGFGGAYCLLSTPSLIWDKVNELNPDVEHLLCVSSGYLLYDCVDLIQNETFKKVLAMIVHHCLCILFCVLILSSHSLHGIGAFCMMIEISGAFLHVRIILLMYDYEKRGAVWNVNAFLNVLMFLVSRLGIILYISIWVVLNQDLVPHVFGLTLPWIGLVILLFNVEIFRRLITSDYLTPHASKGSSYNDYSVLDS